MDDGLAARAAVWADVALANIAREYPNDLRHTMRDADDRPRPHEVHPVFYGSFDWHSCVEMHWLLVRLLRRAAGALPEARIRAALDAQLTPAGLAAEAAYIEQRAGWSRPYGWGWALMLAAELAGWDDVDAARWSDAIGPLADALTRRYLGWLPKQEHPVRHGVHTNTAFGLSRALPYARLREPRLEAAIVETAMQWYAADADYPAHYEPSGSDFLSPALVEAELFATLLGPDEFDAWLTHFLPGVVDGRPAQLFEPVTVTDPTDGALAHLHGLNLSRAWCWRRVADALPPDDPRLGIVRDAAARHAAVSLDAAAGSDYMVEHWLAAYAALLLT